MLRAFVLCVVVAACTGGEPVDTGADAGVPHTTKHAVVGATGKFACRQACWNDVPFNTCRDQRNACYQTSTAHADKVHCREMSRECRAIRRTCLEACNPAPQATD